MILYRILQAALGVTLAILAYFFVVGLEDGSIDASNMLLWLLLLGIPAVALIGAAQLAGTGRRRTACLLLAIPAAPACLWPIRAIDRDPSPRFPVIQDQPRASGK